MVTREPKRRVPELDGLRGIAILLVLVFHYISQGGSYASGSVAGLLQRFVIMGWTGVDLFFVLSGFLIGGILIDARDSPTYFKAFYVRRFFRIIPIYYLWIVLYLGVMGAAGAQVARLSNSGNRPPINFGVFGHFLFLQNVIGSDFAGIAGAWFGHLWSLAVEEQFYLVAPLLVRFVSSRFLKPILVAVIIAVPFFRLSLLWGLHVPALKVTVLMPCRADALAVGMLAAALTRSEDLLRRVREHPVFLHSVLALLTLGIAALWMFAPQSSTLGMQSIGYTWLAFFYVTLLLLAVGQPQSWTGRITRIAWLRELGTVSYCIYIIHIVVNVVVHALLLRRAPSVSTGKGAIVTVLAAFVTYGVAKMSWVLFEGPLQRRGHAFKY